MSHKQKQIWQYSQEEVAAQRKRQAASLIRYIAFAMIEYSMVPLEMVLSRVLLPCK